MLVEKKKYAKEKALFESAQVAAKDETNYADAMIKRVKDAEQKVSDGLNLYHVCKTMTGYENC